MVDIPRAPLDTKIPDWIQWFKVALRYIQKFFPQSQEPPSIADGRPSPPGNCPPRAAEPADAAEENTPNLSEAVDKMLFKPGKAIPNLDDIALDPEVIDPVLSTICMPLLLPKAFKRGDVLGILLHGLPGCGKSLIMRAAAKQYELTLFDVDISAVFSKCQGDSEK